MILSESNTASPMRLLQLCHACVGIGSGSRAAAQPASTGLSSQIPQPPRPPPTPTTSPRPPTPPPPPPPLYAGGNSGCSGCFPGSPGDRGAGDWVDLGLEFGICLPRRAMGRRVDGGKSRSGRPQTTTREIAKKKEKERKER